MIIKTCFLGKHCLDNGIGYRAVFSPNSEIVGATASTLAAVTRLTDNGCANIFLFT
jgi:hypothetical protein